MSPFMMRQMGNYMDPEMLKVAQLADGAPAKEASTEKMTVAQVS
jgi:hypothetical protein